MRTKTKQKKPAIATAEPSPVCRYCGASNWGYSKTTTIVVDTKESQKGDAKITAQEIRCIECGMKATKHDTAVILTTTIFKQIKEQELANV